MERTDTELTFEFQMVQVHHWHPKNRTACEIACEAFPKNTYLFDWLKELQNNSSGEQTYYRSNSTEKKVIQSMAIGTCKYRAGLFTLTERDNFIEDQLNLLPEEDVDESLMQEYVGSAIWYVQNMLDSKCVKNLKNNK